MSEATAIEKWVMTKSMHLGFIRESFSAGTTIAHNVEDGSVFIEGRKFDTSKDLDILKRHGWVVPFSDQIVGEIKGTAVSPDVRQSIPEDKKPDKMEIVESDEDQMKEV